MPAILNMSFRLLTIVIALSASACTTFPADNDTQNPQAQGHPVSIPKDSTWALVLPKDEPVMFSGVVSLDKAGGSTKGMLYPAPNVAGFLAAVATHGILNQSLRNREKDQLRENADKVLQPYQPVIFGFSHKELSQKGLAKCQHGYNMKFVVNTDVANTNWMLVSAPVYFLTQDQNAIILENAISIYASGNRTTPIYTNIIKVVSYPRNHMDMVSYWTADGGSPMKSESAELFAHSIDIAMEAVTAAALTGNETQKTYRYLEGKTEKMERGVKFRQQCNRSILWTLRGELLSVPEKQDLSSNESPSSCKQTSGS